jgi:CheY-like chemotaxis protein
VARKILEGKCIFIVEDDVVNLSVFTASLNISGARVERNVLGYDIVSHILECQPVDLILLDIMLRHGINGYDVYDKIRNAQALRHIPVVAITSLDPEEEIPKAKVKGFNGFIGKPIDVCDFPNHLGRVLNGERIWITPDDA